MSQKFESTNTFIWVPKEICKRLLSYLSKKNWYLPEANLRGKKKHCTIRHLWSIQPRKWFCFHWWSNVRLDWSARLDHICYCSTEKKKLPLNLGTQKKCQSFIWNTVSFNIQLNGPNKKIMINVCRGVFLRNHFILNVLQHLSEHLCHNIKSINW